MSHTKEPWVVSENSRTFIRAATKKKHIGNTESLGDKETDEANARRIVACVNACAGISTENLEDNLPVKELARKYNEVIRPRDELLAALDEAKRVIEMKNFDLKILRSALDPDDFMGEVRMIDFVDDCIGIHCTSAAIASVKGGPT